MPEETAMSAEMRGVQAGPHECLLPEGFGCNLDRAAHARVDLKQHFSRG